MSSFHIPRYNMEDLESSSETIEDNDYYLNMEDFKQKLIVEKLQEWSYLKEIQVIFDSDIDGDGSNGTLTNTIKNKSNLYFISVDDSNNVFGGFVKDKIDHFMKSFYSSSFVFSLLKNGNLNIKKFKFNHGGFLFDYNEIGNGEFLYSFGIAFDTVDIFVCKVNSELSFCQPHCFNYTSNNVLTDNLQKFAFQRIIILEMN